MSRNRILETVEQSSLKSDPPSFEVGDTVEVALRIVEGDKARVQVFSGDVIRRKGAGINETFTVRRIVNNQGVERILPLHSPFIQSIKVKRNGLVRRAKLHYLRDRVGKAVRITERRKTTGKGQADKTTGGESSSSQAEVVQHEKQGDLVASA